MALVFYYKDMLEKVTMKRTQQFSAFSLLPKSPIYMQRVCRKSKKLDWMKNCNLGNTLISREPLIRISQNLARKYFRNK